MTKKQKKNLQRIVISSCILVLLVIAEHFLPLPELLFRLLYLIPYYIIGNDVLLKAWKGIRNRQVFDEAFLMAVATIGAMILGETVEGTAVRLFYQIGELFQSIAVGRSRNSISELMEIRPDYANIINEDGELEKVDPDDLEVGSIIVVQPGERIPIDGIIVEGSSSLNTSALTGESMPRDVSEGDTVISGCLNDNGLIKIRTTREFGESTVSKILDLVENSSMKKAKAENFITKFAWYYTPIVCWSALALAIIPPVILGLQGSGWEFRTWIFRALTFLVISCPCALVISIPLSFFGGIGGASRNGILVKGSNYLEAVADAGIVVFDKTSTLTKGVFEVVDIVPEEGFTEKELLNLAAAAEKYSTHPVAVSLKKTADQDLSGYNIQDEHEISGHGIQAIINGKEVLAGNQKLMRSNNVEYRDNNSAGTIVYVAVDKQFAGSIVISDVVKDNAANALKEIHDTGVRLTVMLTGDNQAAAKAAAEKLGVREYHSELLPGDKVEKIEQYIEIKKPGEIVCFVGDGINDAPVLSRADVGIAMGALGSDAAIEAADIVLMDDDISKIPLAIRIARKCLRIVRENVIFAIGVKILCLILSAFGITNMWWAVFADVGVMVIAVLNATRTLRI